MTFEHQLLIARSPGEVYAFLTDLGNLSRWQSNLQDVRLEREGELEVGSRFTEVREFMGRRVESMMEVTALEPERDFSIRVVKGPIPFAVRHLLAPEATGTRLTLRGEGEPGGFFKIAGGLVGRAAKRQSEKDLARLKQVLESGR